MAKRIIQTFSPQLARDVRDVVRTVKGKGKSGTFNPYEHQGEGDLWGEVVSSATLATNRFVYTMKTYNSPFAVAANFNRQANGAAATILALNTTEYNNTSTLGSEYALTPAGTDCKDMKSVRPIKEAQTRYKLEGPYLNPGNSTYYFAFTARNDPKFGDET